MTKKSSGELSVWTKLSSINVNENTEKKGMFTYLSWAWAWGIVKENYPAATYEIHDNTFYPDDSVETRVSVTIEDQTHTMWLPVMDNKNKPIHGPHARDISDARMRCFVKAIAMHGLGHYIYAGEDIPQTDAEPHIEPVQEKPTPTPKKPVAVPDDASVASEGDMGYIVNTFGWKPQDKEPRSFNDWGVWSDVMCSWVGSAKKSSQLTAFFKENKKSFDLAKRDAESKYDDVISCIASKKEAIEKGN